MTTNQILLMQNRIAELEAENAELKKDLAHEIDMACQAKVCAKHTREQIAALVKGLEWQDEDEYCWKSSDVYYGFYVVRDDFACFYGKAENDIDLLPGETPEQACERHHRETILSLLNL